MRYFLIVLMFMFVWPVKNVLSADAVEAQAGSGQTLRSMREFMEIERRKGEELALLQLELSKLKVELEQKKTLAAMSEIPRNSASAHEGGSKKEQLEFRPVLKSIFLSGSERLAYFDVNGVEAIYREGDIVYGWKVESVLQDGVVLASPDGARIKQQVGL